MRRAIVLVLAATLLWLIAACRSSATGSAPAPSATWAVAIGTNGSIRLTLTVEGPPRNDTVSWVDVAIENVANRGVRWAGGGCGDPGGTFIDATAAFDPGRGNWPGRLGSFKRLALGTVDPRSAQPLNVGYVPEARIGTDLSCPADLRIEVLPAGATLRYRAGWDGRMNDSPTPTGPATVTAMFPFIGLDGLVAADSFETVPLIASVQTAIEGPDGGGGLAPGLAVDAGLADPAFAAFVEAAPPATWINPDVTLIDGLWHIGLFRQGSLPQETLFGEVQVDGHGQVVSRRFEP